MGRIPRIGLFLNRGLSIYKGLKMRDTENYFCLASDGLIYSLGNHGDYEAADDTAESLGLEIIWLFGEDTARSWADTLNAHGVKA